jgi:hypothetical protein
LISHSSLGFQGVQTLRVAAHDLITPFIMLLDGPSLPVQLCYAEEAFQRAACGELE